MDDQLYVCARLESPYPILEVASAPAAGRAVSVGPVRGRRAAEELVEQLASIFGLRHCGRALPRRDHPSAYGQMGRCLSPCLGDLDPNLYRRRLEEALALFEAAGDARQALLDHLEARMREAAALRRYERAAALRRRRERMERLLSRLGGVLEALHARSRLVLVAHPTKKRWDAFWIVGGRVVDWGPLPGEAELAERTLRARERAASAPSGRRWVAAEDVDEVRIVSAFLAAHAPPALPLDAAADRAALRDFMAVAGVGEGRARVG
jgi:DNA polymerase-3 subunit epsilon